MTMRELKRFLDKMKPEAKDLLTEDKSEPDFDFISKDEIWERGFEIGYLKAYFNLKSKLDELEFDLAWYEKYSGKDSKSENEDVEALQVDDSLTELQLNGDESDGQ